MRELIECYAIYTNYVFFQTLPSLNSYLLNHRNVNSLSYDAS